jgi:hypothetical protein
VVLASSLRKSPDLTVAGVGVGPRSD